MPDGLHHTPPAAAAEYMVEHNTDPEVTVQHRQQDKYCTCAHCLQQDYIHRAKVRPGLPKRRRERRDPPTRSLSVPAAGKRRRGMPTRQGPPQRCGHGRVDPALPLLLPCPPAALLSCWCGAPCPSVAASVCLWACTTQPPLARPACNPATPVAIPAPAGGADPKERSLAAAAAAAATRHAGAVVLSWGYGVPGCSCTCLMPWCCRCCLMGLRSGPPS